MRTTTIEAVAEIVSAFIANHKIESADIPELIESTYKTISNISQPAVKRPVRPLYDGKVTKATIRNSIHSDGLVSFIDGKTYKTLTRHLSQHGMTPADYKARFGLPLDYPMISIEYSATRSELARRVGLGRRKSAEASGRTGAASHSVTGAKAVTDQ